MHNNRNIFIYVKRTSHLCIAEQTVRQVEQTKRGVRPLFLLHITGGSVSMARYHGLPQVSRLFLMWQGHRELEFGRRQQMRTSALPHLREYRHISPTRLRKGKRHWLIKMKKLCQDQLPLEQYRDDVCGAVRQALFGQRLFKRKVLLCVKAQRCSNYVQLFCASMFWGDKCERFSFALHYSGVLTWFLDIYDCCTTAFYMSGGGGQKEIHSFMRSLTDYCWWMTGEFNLKMQMCFEQQNHSLYMWIYRKSALFSVIFAVTFVAEQTQLRVFWVSLSILLPGLLQMNQNQIICSAWEHPAVSKITLQTGGITGIAVK